MRIKIFLNLFLLGLVVFGTGCASIVKGRYQEVSFQSMPDEVTVKIDGRTMGKTPLTANLVKRSGQIVVFEKDGYRPLTMSLETRMSGWFWGNIVLGGFLGSTTDGVTGAVNEYSPSQYMITLQPVTSNQVTAAVQRPQGDRIKEFVIVGYSSIRADLNAGAGQYLNSLLELLNVSADKRKEATVRLKGLADRYLNVMDFAEQVAASFAAKEGASVEAFNTLPKENPQSPVTTVKSPASWEGMDCDKYYCLTLVSPESQARRISQLQKSKEYSDQVILGNIIKEAKTRIRVCSKGNVFIDPETKLDSGEKDFLDYLCKAGELGS